ncbi:hypothetical protein Tco_0436127 [Tanacetum coccineum]
MMLESIENGPLVYPTVEVDGQIQKKKYTELTEQEQLQDDCDVQATNIVLQGLPPDVYALVNHCQSAKDIWQRLGEKDIWLGNATLTKEAKERKHRFKEKLMLVLEAQLKRCLNRIVNHVTNWDKVNQETKSVNESLTAKLERYKERVKTFEQRLNVDLSSREKLIDSQSLFSGIWTPELQAYDRKPLAAQSTFRMHKICYGNVRFGKQIRLQDMGFGDNYQRAMFAISGVYYLDRAIGNKPIFHWKILWIQIFKVAFRKKYCLHRD